MRLYFLIFICFGFTACAQTKKTAKTSYKIEASVNKLINGESLKNAHVGMCVYNAQTGERITQHNEERYFTPASNTKLYTCFASLASLGDSLVAFNYATIGDTLFINPTGDPSFLHTDFVNHPAYQFLLQSNAKYIKLVSNNLPIKYGPGWSWDDYSEGYMPERSAFPMFGNGALFSNKKIFNHPYYERLQTTASFKNKTIFVAPALFADSFAAAPKGFSRSEYYNNFDPTPTDNFDFVPFKINANLPLQILQQATGKQVSWCAKPTNVAWNVIHSQAIDSLIKPMMHRSDNFYAEQLLLMCAYQKFGVFNQDSIINKVIQNIYANNKTLEPAWVDGSGLSRYNQFSPKGVMLLLQAMEKQFGMPRLKVLMPGADQGTLKGLYKNLQGKFFAKTGTLSGQSGLSGYFYGQTGKLYYFSLFANNYPGKAALVRKSFEQFIGDIIPLL
jgi:serine-type D-Ala-D-Ala carboxypeptidase/endopeptidase (penicillin-binding protein 4)